ncbi:hypothetical protein R6Q59_017110 [Mikania micrantha]
MVEDMPGTSYEELLKDGQHEPGQKVSEPFARFVFVSPLTLNKVQIEFNPMSVDVKFHDVSVKITVVPYPN